MDGEEGARSESHAAGPQKPRLVDPIRCVGLVLLVLNVCFMFLPFIGSCNTSMLHIITVVLSLLGLALLRYQGLATSHTHKRPCNSELCMARCLVLITAVRMPLTANSSSDWREGQWIQFMHVVGIVCIGVFSVSWLRRLAISTTHQEDNAADGQAQCREARFRTIARIESRKFEIAYVVVEAISLFFLSMGFVDVRDGEHIDGGTVLMVRSLRLRRFLSPFCIVLRLERCIFGSLTSRDMEMWGALLDFMNFTFNALLSGFIGSYILASFMINIMLSYMLLFVFPFRRALIVAPTCCVAYSLAAVSGATLHRVALETAVLSIGLCLALAAKRIIERSKWEAFVMLEEKTQLALQEKVRRFEAEFQTEVERGSFERHESSERSTYLQGAHVPHVVGHEQLSIGSHVGVVPTLTMSVHSAPTVLLTCPEGDVVQNESKVYCSEGDCLPLDALVWVEGETLPRPLGKLAIGDRVLCYDRLAGSMKHAGLIDVRMESGPKEWASVTLHDGTCLDMTVDHFVQLAKAPTAAADPTGPTTLLTRSSIPVRAGELKPGIDSLMVLKAAPVRVMAVERRAAERERISLTVQHSERHAIFVAAPGQALGTFQTMAVESANVGATGFHRMVAHRTFLNVEDETSQSELAEARRKPCSAPPSLHAARQQEPCVPQMDPAVVELVEPTSQLQRPSGDMAVDSVSLASSTPSALSTGCNDVLLRLPSETAEVPPASTGACHPDTEAGNSSSSARLSAPSHAQASSYASVGSIGHALGQCRPCIFHNRHRFYGTPPCYKGVLCERCHETHEENITVEKRHARRIKKRPRTSSAGAPAGEALDA